MIALDDIAADAAPVLDPASRGDLAAAYTERTVLSLVSAQNLLAAITRGIASGLYTETEVDTLIVALFRSLNDAGEHLQCRRAVFDCAGVA